MTAPSLARAMTPFPYSVDIDDCLEAAIKLMQAHNIRHVPVTSRSRVIGVVTDRDIKAAQRLLPELQNFPVRTAYEDTPYVVDIDTRLDAVLTDMAERQIGSAIVTRREKLVGIFTCIDACRTFAAYLRAQGGDEDGPVEAA